MARQKSTGHLGGHCWNEVIRHTGQETATNRTGDTNKF